MDNKKREVEICTSGRFRSMGVYSLLPFFCMYPGSTNCHCQNKANDRAGQERYYELWTAFRPSSLSDLCLRIIRGSKDVNTRHKDDSARGAIVNSDMSS